MNQQTKKKIFDNLDVLGAIVMIVALFLGAFYKDNGGVFGALQYPGYRLIFNSDYMLGTLVIVLPLIVLITNYVDALKKYDKLIKLVLPAITLIFVFVLKGQVADEIATDSGAALSFALGGWIYILGNLIGLAAGAAGFFGVNLEKKADELISKKK
ncbi:hypothetical protein PGA57_09350 [Latilactobacillus curvatus]|uniref:hypothetical protein n=1 Tax=Latilactobacillus curvatus TaxID=28038 RepID=UPI0022F39B0A|nr:hypothetical protein [Latilactobacillus curvatus]WBY48787.1 hypothetical protein PGA57_09350 [Latilactobacillus curvatus]